MQTLDHQFIPPDAFPELGIGVIGAGFIVRDCHLVAYQQAGFRATAITSRSRARAEEVAAARGVPRVWGTPEELLDDPEVQIVDVGVPPQFQADLIRVIARHPRAGRPGGIRGVLAQKPLAMNLADAREIVVRCAEAGVTLAVNQNMRHDQSVRACKDLLQRGLLGEPVLGTIDMRAIPHWMPWSQGLHSLSTFIMSIHHLDCFRYWFGDPIRVMASTRPDPRTTFPHTDGINLYILEFTNGCRASSWDDVWSGPVREGTAGDIGIRWRVEGTAGMARGTIGWPSYPEHTPSTLDYTCQQTGAEWLTPRWPEAWFPEAFRGTMGELLLAVRSGAEPPISGRDNLKTIALVEAVFSAARDHRVVELAETDVS